LCSLTGAACGRRSAGPIDAAIVEGAQHQRVIRITGLSAGELSSLRSVPPEDPRWTTYFDVRVAGATVPMAGRYRVTADSVEFHPSFPLDAGRPYVVRSVPAAWPVPRAGGAVEHVLTLPGLALPPRAEVARIAPSADHWPSNILRFYIHFSSAMSRDTAVGRVHLVGRDGVEIPHAFLPVDVDLWDREYRRFTVLFDPGRVKRDILPNRQLGRALVEGRRYAIVVDPEWLDAAGQPLARGFRHEFIAGPAVEQPLDVHAWRLSAPRAGTRDPFVVTFPAMLDEALLHRTLGVSRAGGAPVDGNIVVNAEQTEWRFQPAADWAAGRYDLVALSILEDPSGNRIAHAFEAPNGENQANERSDYRIGFEIK